MQVQGLNEHCLVSHSKEWKQFSAPGTLVSLLQTESFFDVHVWVESFFILIVTILLIINQILWLSSYLTVSATCFLLFLGTIYNLDDTTRFKQRHMLLIFFTIYASCVCTYIYIYIYLHLMSLLKWKDHTILYREARYNIFILWWYL